MTRKILASFLCALALHASPAIGATAPDGADDLATPLVVDITMPGGSGVLRFDYGGPLPAALYTFDNVSNFRADLRYGDQSWDESHMTGKHVDSVVGDGRFWLLDNGASIYFDDAHNGSGEESILLFDNGESVLSFDEGDLRKLFFRIDGDVAGDYSVAITIIPEPATTGIIVVAVAPLAYRQRTRRPRVRTG